MAYKDLVKPEEDWQERVEKLCDPKNFWVSIRAYPVVFESLTPKRQERLCAKLSLVEKAACMMAAGMLKGVLKYETDDHPVETWLAHVLDEGADQMNYQMLLAEATQKLLDKIDSMPLLDGP